MGISSWGKKKVCCTTQIQTDQSQIRAMLLLDEFELLVGEMNAVGQDGSLIQQTAFIINLA